MAILITIIGFGIMVFLHELGHFLVAKKFGVLVHEFAIGMGPKLFSFGKGETKYSLRLLPIGGFVQLEGEGELEENNNPRSFSNRTPPFPSASRKDRWNTISLQSRSAQARAL